MTNTITAAQTKDMFLHVADRIVAAKEALCEADRNIGDGDHGIGMANGFEAVSKQLQAQEFTDVYAVFNTVGRTMIRVMGGASGIIFGLLFFAGSKNIPPRAELTTAEFTEIFEKALSEIKAKGGAGLGDKTVVDGLSPTIDSMKDSVAQGSTYKDLFQAATRAAETGKQKSMEFIARFGKAKTLGERAIGYPDAGCVTLTVIFNAMSEWAEKNL
jgi:dihydroxyacetone kinase phosphoprotein-dependent L subunit